MKNEKITIRDHIQANLRAITITRKILPGFVSLTVVISLMKAVLPYLTIFFSARIIAELAGGHDPKTLMRWVVGALIAYAVPSLIQQGLQRKRDVLNSISWNAWTKLLSDKKLSMDYQDLDDSRVISQYEQIAQTNQYNGGGYFRATWSLEGLLTATIGVIGAVALSVSLFTRKVPKGSSYAFLNNPAFVLLILGVLLFVILEGPIVRTKSNDMMYGNMEAARYSNRVFGHFGFFSIKRPEAAMDIRMYDHQKIGAYYHDRDLTWKPGGTFAKLTWGKAGWLDILAELIAVLAVVTAYIFVCLKALGGAFGIGEVTQYVGAITALTVSLSDLLNEVGRLKNNTKYLKALYTYLDLPNHMYQGTLTTEKRADRQYEVEFRDVSFRYPGTEIYALRHVSMKFKVGERLAIVGMNGSGKTTFIKLLCRLYDPTEGEILLNGIDIRKYNYQDYMQIFSIVFQDFKLLSFPLGQNVAASAEYDKERVYRALRDAGFEEKILEMPQGIDTCLYHDYSDDGVDISGGEAQKIAIARALYKDAPFIILDEPTASLDPIAEAEIYEKFDEISGDRTAIYISHRLSSCKFCDEIAVFDEGQIVQQGRHEDLLKDEDGKYYELWNAQAKYYQ